MQRLFIPGGPRGVAALVAGTSYVCVGTTIVKSVGNGTPTPIITGLNQPTGIAVDASGNLYVTDPGAGQVYKETLSGGTFTQSTIASVTANGIAVDGSGNIYLADTIGDSVRRRYPRSSVVLEACSLLLS